MPGTAGSGNRASDQASRNAQHARGTRADTGGAHPNQARGLEEPEVHAEPAAGAGFSFERAAKHQCIKGVQYALPEECAERTYFQKHLAVLIAQTADLPVSAPQHQLLSAMRQALGGEALQIRTIAYGQLARVSDSQQLSDTWESYEEGGKNMARAPSGEQYEVKKLRGLPWEVVITATMDVDYNKDKDNNVVDDIEYACTTRMTKRSEHHLYSQQMKKGEFACQLQVGEINASTGNLVPWKEIVITAKDTMNALFYQYNTKGAHWPDEIEEEQEEEPFERQAAGARQRFNLMCKDGRMAYSHLDKSSKEPEWIAVTDFELHRLDSIYMFVEDDCGDPYAKVICRVHLDGEEGCLYLRADDQFRTPNTDGYEYLDVEVLVQLGYLRSNADVKKLFLKYHASLTCTIMTPDMLACWIAEQKKPAVTKCIVRFGRQTYQSNRPGYDEFISGNLWFKGPVLRSHEQANVAVVPQYFKDSILPVPKDDYPRNIIIPQCHVRYVIGVNFWTNLIPQMFCNNKLVAMATFAHFVMGLYATKIWGGECGFGHGMPFAWVYSNEPNTGKTEACLAGNSMLGFYARSMWAGDCTKSAMFERLHQQTDLTVAVDDVVLDPNRTDSKVFAQMGRALFDRTSRAVTGKIRRPHSSAIFTVPCTRTHLPCPPSRSSKTSGPIHQRAGSLSHTHPNSSNHASCDAR